MRLRSLSPISALVLSSLLAPLLTAAEVTFVVAPGGDDGNPGTTERPFATPARALKEIRKLTGAGLSGDVRVQLRGGTYWLTEPLRFGLGDGGDKRFAVVWEAFPGERPRLSGGRAVSGWQVRPDGRWVTTVPDAGKWSFRELFVNGQRRPRARHPNEGYLRIEETAPDRRTGFTFAGGDLKPFDAAGTELVFLHDWSISRIPLKAVDFDRRTVTTAAPVGAVAPHYAIDHYEKHPRYFLENAAAFLDAPGEWHLTPAGELTYWPLPGETPEAAEVIAPRATRLIEVAGDQYTARPVRNLRFRGLALEHCAWDIPRGGYAEGQSAVYDDRDRAVGKNVSRVMMPAAVRFEWAENCGFENSRLAHIGCGAVWFGRGCRGCRVTGSVVEDVAGNGVMAGEMTATARDVASGTIVENNLIQDCGRLYFGAVGVWVGIAEKTRVAHNVIRRLPYTGVSVGWRWNPDPTPCRENVVENNHIHHVLQALSDGGGIYTLGRQPGTILRGNHIHDVPLNAGRAESNGMFLDEGTTDIVIENNLIYSVTRSPLRFHRAGVNLVRGNTLLLSPDVPVVRYNNTPEANVRLEDNAVTPQADADVAGLAAKSDAGLTEPFRHLLQQAE